MIKLCILVLSLAVVDLNEQGLGQRTLSSGFIQEHLYDFYGVYGTCDVLLGHDVQSKAVLLFISKQGEYMYSNFDSAFIFNTINEMWQA